MRSMVRGAFARRIRYLIAHRRGALYLPPLVHPWRHVMRADVEAAAADIEQSIGLLRRRL